MEVLTDIPLVKSGTNVTNSMRNVIDVGNAIRILTWNCAEEGSCSTS